MTTIGGFINGILDGTIPSEKQEYYLGIVSDEVKRLSGLVNTMLNISRIETGNVELVYESFNLTELILSVFLGFEQIIENRGINIFGLDFLEPMVINADKDMINQMIYNLIDNAVKFSNDNGDIIITASQTPSDISLSIRNSGSGIPKEEIENIFERFYKVDKSRSSDSKSVGLGLHIIKSIIELHHGSINVKSFENEFTEFLIALPKSVK